VGYISADFPFTPELNKPFNIDVFLRPNDPHFRGSTTVYMEQTDKVLYEPRVFVLGAGKRKTIKATVLKSYCGLGEVIATSIGWNSLEEPINLGFAAKMTAKTLDQPLEGGDIKSVSLEFVDNLGKPAPLDTAVNLIVRSTKAMIRDQPGKSWTDLMELDVQQGASATQPFEVRPATWWADEAMLSLEVRLNQDFVALDQNITFTVLSRWYLQLLMAIFGGALYSFYKALRTVIPTKLSLRTKALTILGIGLGGGIPTGGLAFLLANWNVIGIKVDTTSPQGFVILGVLISYVGVDWILSRIVKA
jgi:hypothetical protein